MEKISKRVKNKNRIIITPLTFPKTYVKIWPKENNPMANDLIKYLNKYFQGSQGTYENNPVDVYSHFLDKFGVNVK